ncbi:MAG: BamA/TamA family outer membrane protein [Deltaproteobacteria bacterium]|nr:BamA/TamA family outer membrane protein [Deltaproteobacteria bacterium]
MLTGIANGQPTEEPPPKPAEPTEPTPPTEPPKPAEPTPPAEPQSAPPLSAADVRGSALPGAEHGRLDPIDTGDGMGRKIAAALLWIPRFPIQLALQPIRGALYLKSKRPEVIATGDPEEQAFQYAPIVLAESGLGFAAGLRLRFYGLMGLGERIEARIAAGSSYKPVATLAIEKGKRVAVGIAGVFEDAEQPFYGYGNGDATQATPIDPLTSDATSSTQYEVRQIQVGLYSRVRLPQHVVVKGSTTLARRSFETDGPRDGELPIEEAFVVDNLTGFNTGTSSLYSELELSWDTRRTAHPWDPSGMYGTGGRVAVFGGRYEGLRKDDPGMFRFGLDAERFIPLTIGPRVLSLRAYGEVVTGDRDEVPFANLPRLGGTWVLRGYDVDRFRDRVAAVVQANYRWRAAAWLAMVVFVDAGRVYESLGKVSLDDLRLGYGGALEVYNGKNVFVRGQVASSIDGGVFLHFSFGASLVSPSRGGRF